MSLLTTQADAVAAADKAQGKALDKARRTVLAALCLALAGSVTGLTLGRSTGAVFGPELWLVGSCAVFCVGMLVLLLARPFDRMPWVVPVSSLFFLLYLTLGALASIGRESILQSLLVYLIWFFPLLAFNRFVNVTAHHARLTFVIYLASILLAVGRIAIVPATSSEVPLLMVYCFSDTAFVLMLGMFAKYREAHIKTLEGEQALVATHRAVLASEDNFRRLFANAASGIGWIAEDGRCRNVNAAFARMAGASPEALNDTMFDSLVAADSRQAWAKVHQHIRSGEQAGLSAELRLLAIDGRDLWTKISFAVVKDAADGSLATVFVCFDNTEAHGVDVRLRQAQRLEAVGQLTGGIAHDFNNLLTVILGNSELLREQLSPANPSLAALADMSVTAAERGADLTQRLLAFARKQPLAPQAVDAAQLVAGMEPLLRRTLGEHIEIRFAPAAGLWPALVDPVQLESALLNLCLNARDAMVGGGSLTIATANTNLSEDEVRQRGDVQPGSYVMLSVSDTGTGIAPEHLSHVFEPFFTTKGTGKGSGLGLAMIYGFVRQSGGHVSVDSEAGHGTAVRLYLPRALQAATQPQPAVCDAQTVGGTERVLLVEDDELVRRYAYDQLVALGYEVRQAHGGAQGLEMFSRDIGIDLLFTDVVMPGMSGRQLADHARALRPALKVLYASGYAENEIVHHGRLDAGAQLLAKPYRRDELARRIRAVLDDQLPHLAKASAP
ncbi:MAG: ATP-binding protein [Ramlibacter sp.]